MPVLRVVVFVSLCAVWTAGPALAAVSPVSHGAAIAAAAAPPASVVDWVMTLASLVAIGGVIRLRDVGSMSKKFVQRAGAATGDYTSGVTGAGQAWASGAAAAEDTYKTAVTQAASENRYGKGVQEAGAAKYEQRAKTLGAQRYAPGVQAAEGDWARGFSPFASALNGMDLPPRGPRGSAQNQTISNAVASRLHAIRVGK